MACSQDQIDVLERTIGPVAASIQEEYQATDPRLRVHVERKGAVKASRHGITENDTATVVNLLMALPSGPAEMTEAFPLLVETSSNLSMLEIDNDTLAVISNLRSSVPSRLDAICQAVEAVGRLAGATVHTGLGYPSWPMNPESPLLHRCTMLYRDLFGVVPTVQIMHAGLECGVIGDRCPGMDMISLGPTMENPHSPSERLYLPSVEKVWRLLVALLDDLGR